MRTPIPAHSFVLSDSFGGEGLLDAVVSPRFSLEEAMRQASRRDSEGYVEIINFEGETTRHHIHRFEGEVRDLVARATVNVDELCRLIRGRKLRLSVYTPIVARWHPQAWISFRGKSTDYLEQGSWALPLLLCCLPVLPNGFHHCVPLVDGAGVICLTRHRRNSSSVTIEPFDREFFNDETRLLTLQVV